MDLKKFWDLLFPEYRCILCGREAEDNKTNICNACKKEAGFLTEDNVCEKCGMPLHNEFEKVCESCKKSHYAFYMARAVMAYNHSSIPAVQGLKYERQTYKAKYMAKLMAQKLKELGWKIDFICFVPMTDKKKKSRGFNQAELLANEIGKDLGIDVVSALCKVKETESQTTFNAEERQKNLHGSFALNKTIEKHIFENKNVLVIDDVFTTGSTLNECSKLLNKTRINKVYCLTFAKVILD